MKGVGLFVEENLQEIVSRFHASVERELGFEEPALKLAAPILLSDLARHFRQGSTQPEPWRRAMVLVFSQPPGGIRGLVREVGLLRRCLWETLALRHCPVPGDERRAIDQQLDEALAFAAERWASLVRLLSPDVARVNLGLSAPSAPPPIPSAPQRRPPPPLPQRRNTLREEGEQASPATQRNPRGELPD